MFKNNVKTIISSLKVGTNGGDFLNMVIGF